MTDRLLSRKQAIGSLVASAFACGAGLSAVSSACAEEQAPELSSVTGFTLPAGLKLTDDGTLGDVLVVVDMQNAYLEDQCWACTSTSQCVKNIIALIESGAVDNVVFTEYLAPKNPVGTWVTYNEVNAEVNADPWLNAVIDELQPYAEKYPLYDKSTYSSYGNPDFKALMEKADRFVMSGVMAECCVLATAIDAIDTGIPLVYLTDACSGSSKEYEEATVRMMEFAATHATVMTCEEYRAARGA